MGVVKFTDALPASYLSRFVPPANVKTRVSVLSDQALELRSHWVDNPDLEVKGFFECVGTVCCQALGVSYPRYIVPVFVYTNPIVESGGQYYGTLDGTVQYWPLTRAQYVSLQSLHSSQSLLKYDLEVEAKMRGDNRDINFTIFAAVQSRQFWTAEFKQGVDIAVGSFFGTGETTYQTSMTEAEWVGLLQAGQGGFKVNSKFGKPKLPGVPAYGSTSSLAAPVVAPAPVLVSPQVSSVPVGAPRVSSVPVGAPQVSSIPVSPGVNLSSSSPVPDKGLLQVNKGVVTPVAPQVQVDRSVDVNLGSVAPVAPAASVVPRVQVDESVVSGEAAPLKAIPTVVGPPTPQKVISAEELDSLLGISSGAVGV